MISAERTVYELFDGIASRTPDAIAIRYRGASCSYGELAARAMTLARRLPGSVDPPAFVILLGNEPIAETSAVLAALAVGGVAAPVDSQQPEFRLASIVAHCSPTAILATAALSGLAARLAARIPVLVIPNTIDEDARVAIRATPDADAYVCYTSGSTGVPKGLVATHRQLVARALATGSALGIRNDDRHTALHSAAVGAGCSTLWRTLLTGGTLLPRRVPVEGVQRMLEWLNTEEATILACSPALFRTFMGTLAAGDLLRTVRLLRIGGERVTPADHDLFKRHFSPGARFVNAYSCTEASNVTLHVMTHDSVCDEDSVPVGHPLPGCRVSILDEDGNNLPPGSIGEIAVEGPFLARGYFRDGETGKPFERVSGDPGAIRLRTGDIGKMRADGSLVHLGRKDFRVKIRGFRVELEAIEAVLQQAPGVHAAAVLVRETAASATTLMAYVTTDGSVADTEQLWAHARAHLPTGSVPHHFAVIDAMPLTASGKIDRKALQALDAAGLDHDAPAPSTATGDEAAIADIWRDVLGHARFGRHDDFLSAGGDSLSAMRVLTRIRQRLDVEIAVQTFLGSPTVVALSAAVSEARRRDAALDERDLRALLDEMEAERSRPLD